MKKFVRYDFCGAVEYGVLCGAEPGAAAEISVLDRDFLDPESRPTGEKRRLADVRLLSPVVPPNILAIGLNYKPHAAETNLKLPALPLIFIKATTSLANPGDDIVLPAIAPSEVDYEGELAIVIGKRAKNVSEEDALDYVLGYTIANDVSARDCQMKIDGQWARGKSFDSFCPLGPAVVQGVNGDDLAIQTKLNGEIMQKSRTSQLIFGLSRLVSFCSRNMTLLPGTVILTGTPEGVGFSRQPPVYLKPGDVVEISIENLGTLSNKVAAEA